MTPRMPGWTARLLGRPGSASFARLTPIVASAREREPAMRELDDAALAAEARGARVATGARLPRVETALLLAALREAADRALGLRPFDEQLLACCALLSGHAVEMDTGEGKTLVGALAAAGHALAGRRVHVLSVNDYLAERDAAWMRPLLELLGVSVAWVGQRTTRAERQGAYRADVVYAPVSEVGFDVLRDRLATSEAERVEPVLDVAIVDEADAVMLDEAMVPLVLAGTVDEASDDLAAATALVERLVEGDDFAVDAEGATASLTDAGIERLERSLGIDLYDEHGLDVLTRLNLALHARTLVHRDVDYLVVDGAIVLVNAARGRIAHRQRWPDGLHAALEAKERLDPSPTGVVLDSMTIQDLLLRYAIRSGMSGTIVAVADELVERYGLASGRVERHVPSRRVDEPDAVLAHEAEKTQAIVAEVAALHGTGRPVLVGTQSVAESESLAALLDRAGIRARVLNARNDADEAEVIARAGEHGAVTISTQMSGRGTDIRLGGPDERNRDRVVALGGLAVVASGRYPSGRLDAQLRGRAGRQGDPGTSHAFASLDDDLVVAHAPDHVRTTIARHAESMPERERAGIVDRCQAIADGQRRDRQRATWAYTRAIAAQRDAVLAERRAIVGGDGVPEPLRERVPDALATLERAAGADAVAATTRAIVLHHLDDAWVTHLAILQEIRDGIHLRSLVGQDPAQEFHLQALREFEGLLDGAFDAAAARVAALGPADVGRDLADLGMRRPGSTWTYMVTDDPLGSPGDRFVRGAGHLWRSRVLGLE